MTNFRSYEQFSTQFGEGINCIHGKNGVGKTNILDALHYLAFTRGIRSHQDQYALKEGETFFMIGGKVKIEGYTNDIQCNFIKTKGKKILVAGKPLAKMSEHIGKIPMVAIFPHDTELVNGPSAVRRKFMDILISQYSPNYLRSLIQYEKILAQRNALLKTFAEQQYFDAEQLEIWDSQIIPYGIQISKERQEFLEAYTPVFSDYFKKIVSEKEQPKVAYRTQVKENTIDGWLALFKERLQKDLMNNYTTGGIHRDNLLFTINQQTVKNYGSQGQQKTFVTALKLAQYDLLRNRTQTDPILLLDDVFDKLDEHRLGRIANILDREINGQVFITDTSLQRFEEIFSNPLNSVVEYLGIK